MYILVDSRVTLLTSQMAKRTLVLVHSDIGSQSPQPAMGQEGTQVEEEFNESAHTCKA